MSNIANKWPKVITVDKNIIKILSESTYENFPNALKEVITNSYDALATEVIVEVDLKKESVVVWDNGNGMDETDYEFYLRIAGKRRTSVETGKPVRTKIGQFGVGFLSVFPFFKNYKIETKKSGKAEILHSEIPCYLYFDEKNRFVQISDIKIDGGKRETNRDLKEHFTKITLTGFTPITKDFFHPEVNKNFKPSKHSIKNPDYFKTLEKLKWLLEEDLPLKFKDENFNELFTDYSASLPFSVKFNNEVMFRKVYATKHILDRHESPYSEIGKIKYQYFISTDKKSVYPNEARYLKIRNLNVGVGERENFIGKEIIGGYPRLHQLTGEIHIIDGMNDLIKVSRDGFNYSQDYEQLKSIFGKKLIRYSADLQKESDDEKASSATRVRALKYIEPVGDVIKKGTPIIFKEHRQLDKKSVKRDLKSKPAKENILEISNHRFLVKSDKWDYEKGKFPACKIHGDYLIINSKYPLFKGVKHTDVFIKFHVFLLLNLMNSNISHASYSKMAKEILNIYSEYR